MLQSKLNDVQLMDCGLSRHQLMKWTKIKSSAFSTRASLVLLLCSLSSPLRSSSSLSLSCLTLFVWSCECLTLCLCLVKSVFSRQCGCSGCKRGFFLFCIKEGWVERKGVLGDMRNRNTWTQWEGGRVAAGLFVSTCVLDSWLAVSQSVGYSYWNISTMTSRLMELLIKYFAVSIIILVLVFSQYCKPSLLLRFWI